MDSEPGLTATGIQIFLRALAELGFEDESLLEDCGIDRDRIDDSEYRVPLRTMGQLYDTARSRTGDPGIGLHAGACAQPIAHSIAIYLLMTSRTVGEGLERVVQYQRLVVHAERLSLISNGATRALCFELPELGPVGLEYQVVAVVRLLDWVTEETFHPTEVLLGHEPLVDPAEYTDVLGCPVKFGCDTYEIRIAKIRLEWPSLHAHPDLARAHHEYAEQRLADLEDRSVSRRVHGVATALLEDGAPLAQVARALAMSPRTMQRRLAEEGTRYSQILDELREHMALEQLSHPSMPLTEIAYLTGFSDATALSRAVRRWTGQSPLSYRRAAIQGAESHSGANRA